MKVGLHIPDFTWEGGPPSLRVRLGEVARQAEQAGVDRISVMDHVWQIGHIGPPEHEMLEAYTTLGWLAAKTDRVKLLTVVTAVVYREPGLLAKAVTTLDVLSGGRAMLGIGRPGTKRKRVGWAYSSRRSGNGSNGWRRRCASAGRCGVMTTARSTGSTTSWVAH